MLGLKNCSSVSVSGWKIDSPIETFVKVNGGKSNDIMVYNNNGIFSKKIQVGNDVAKSAIIE
jgi:hypothetical protein